MAAEAGYIPEPPFLKPRTGFAASNFAVKAAFLVFSVVLLSVYPSRAPDFLGESFLNQGWELLHLLLVGIAVSYGLFSHRNADADAEKVTSATAATVVNKAEASMPYLSRMNLRVATVFEEDDEDVEREAVLNETRMWSSQYSRAEPTVVLAEKRSLDAKPLCLPVRSLRPQVHEPPRADSTSRAEAEEEVASSREARQFFGSPRRMDGSERNGKLKNVQPAYVEPSKEEEPTPVVLPSPIPWRSRSGRLEPNVKQGTSTPPPSPRPTKSASPLSPDVDPGVSRTPSFRSTSASRKLPPPPPPPPRFSSPSPSAEVGTKTVEDVPKRRSVRRSPAVPPPPPPPPPPPMASSRSHRIHNSSNDQQLRRSFTDELKEASTSGGRERAPNSAWAEAPEVAREQPPPLPEASSQKLPPRTGKKNRKKKPPRRFIIESDESDHSSDSSTTDDADHGGASSSATDAEADANEVDKKADEFIAKFREQIRLQRIESIKKSAQQRQRAGKSST